MKTDFGLLGRQSRVAFSHISGPGGRSETSSDGAFTRTELLATLAALFLLGVVALPLLAGSKPRSERVLCLNNLRQIGVAFNLWASDHGNYFPWRAEISQGGNRGAALAGNNWYHFAFVSNELASPKVLVCPADTTKKMASTWGNEAGNGFLNSSMRNNASSYTIGLDSSPDGANHVVSSDRNLSYSFLSACSTGILPVPGILTTVISQSPRWTEDIHGSSGNALLGDGRAVELSSQGLAETISGQNDNGGFNGVIHFLDPR